MVGLEWRPACASGFVHDALDVRFGDAVGSFVVALVVARRSALTLELLIPIVRTADPFPFFFVFSARQRNHRHVIVFGHLDLRHNPSKRGAVT